MVKHPKYQAMDSARESEIPVIFKRVCEGTGYVIKEFAPKIPDERVCGPIPRASYHVFRKSDRTLMAEFYANGHSELKDEEFQPYYEKMVGMIEGSAQRALDEYKRHDPDCDRF